MNIMGLGPEYCDRNYKRAWKSKNLVWVASSNVGRMCNEHGDVHLFETEPGESTPLNHEELLEFIKEQEAEVAKLNNLNVFLDNYNKGLSVDLIKQCGVNRFLSLLAIAFGLSGLILSLYKLLH